MDKELCSIATEHFTIEGRSRAGNESWFRMRELGIALDIGRGPDAIISMQHVFVTHAHLDHSLGIPFYAGQRHLQRMARGTVYVPSESEADFRELMNIHRRLENTDYDMEIRGLSPGDTIPISRTLRARAHKATHRVPANAYEILEVRHHLRPEFVGLDGPTLGAMRKEGREIADEVLQSLLFYTGDTDRGILEAGGAIFQAEVLMIECSFLGENDQDRAAAYRHIHFDDLIEFADRFENRMIVLTHFSLRYSHDEIVTRLRKRCPQVLRERLRLAFPEPWQRL